MLTLIYGVFGGIHGGGGWHDGPKDARSAIDKVLQPGYKHWIKKVLSIPIFKKSDLGCSYQDVDKIAYDMGKCMLQKVGEY